MHLILHPGHGKCGSTSIQKWLSNNLEALHQNGVSVPSDEFAYNSPINGTELLTYPFYFSLLEQGSEFEFRQRVTKFIEESDTEIALVSEEFLTDPRVLDEGSFIHHVLKSEFESFKVIYYIRRQDDFILSGWQQWRHKIGLTLDQEYQRMLKEHSPSYLRNITFLENLYGPENVIVRPFDRKFFKNGNLIEDFCEWLKLGYENFEDPNEQSNVSLNPYICDVLALVHDGLYEDSFINHNVKDWIHNNSKSEIIRRGNKEFLTQEMRMDIMNYFQDENEKIHDTYLSSYSYNDLFGPKTINENKNDLEGLKLNIAIQYELMFSMKQQIDSQQREISRLKKESQQIKGYKEILSDLLKRIFK